MCSHTHFDLGHKIDWGFDIFEHLELPKNDVNEKFNEGY